MGAIYVIQHFPVTTYLKRKNRNKPTPKTQNTEINVNIFSLTQHIKKLYQYIINIKITHKIASIFCTDSLKFGVHF